MSDNTYHVVDVDLTDAEELKPDVHLEVAERNSTLPNLNNAELPIELVQAILLVKSRPTLSDEETSACMAAFLAYFQAMSRTSGTCCARRNVRSPTSPPR